MIVLEPPFFPIGNIHHNSPLTSFHAVVGLWKERNYCVVKKSPSPFFWVGDVGDCLLYQWCTLEHLNPHQRYKNGLFANAEPPINGRRNHRWTFWPRQSHVIESYFACKPLSFQQRRYSCMFIGGYENLTQRGHRCFEYWKPSLDFCDVGIKAGTFTWQEYTRLLRQSRFGLCLRGVGPKCHREIELMAMGSVPIVTPGVDMAGFDDPPVLGKHYLFARSVEDVAELSRSLSESEWNEMSWQCRDWYWRNASPRGVFDTTERIINAQMGGFQEVKVQHCSEEA